MSFGFMFVIVPIGLGLFALELYFLQKRGYKVTLDQTALNISLGFFDRFIGLYLTERSLVLVHEALNYAVLPEMPLNALTFVITFLAVDLIWYVFHVLGHRVSLMWGIHLVHHQSDEYNLSVNFALSPLGFMIRSFMYSFLVVIGFPLEYVVMSSYLNAFYQYYLHTEFINTIPMLDKFMVMPAHHKVHHASNEEYLDKNYGGVFIIWDKMFGTFAPLVAHPKYGLTTPLPHKDFINLQLFFFKKLLNNFRAFGWQKGFALLFKGPEFQTPEVTTVFNFTTKVRVWKLAIGILIYVISYRIMILTDSLPVLITVCLMNLAAIMIVNGIKTPKTEVRWRLFRRRVQSFYESVRIS
ncbi:MAG: hypothetical protein C7N14_05985 [Bacteroidetes bacterium]|nr:MAG: hypothetical protein C7N14_05985 [Bacteroidota bacterium]